MAQGTVYVRNADTEDLFVTIKDLNAAGNPVVWDQKRLNEDRSEPLTCEIDGNFEAHLEWTAVSTSDGTITNSGTEKVGESNELEVYAS